MRNHLKLLCDFSELNWVFNESHSLEKFLDRLVDMVAEHMRTRVCSLYLFYQAAAELRLVASHGLKAGASGRVRLHLGEGLTGQALAEGRTLVTARASQHPNYRFFGGIDEELYEAFLAQPLLRGIKRIGVLVLQREETLPFTEGEVTVTQTIASQLVNIVENAQLLGDRDESLSRPVASAEPLPVLLRGKSASEGVAEGPLLVRRQHQDLRLYLRNLPMENKGEADFQASLARTEAQLEQIQAEIEEQLSDVASLIFSAHLLMLKDQGLIRRIEQAMTEGCSAAEAIVATAEYYIDRFQKVEDHYIREKADDVRDLARRLLDNLYFLEGDDVEALAGRVVVADHLLPSDILKLSHEKISGVVLVSGGVTSHVALLARSLEIPLLIVDEPRLLDLGRDQWLLIDAESGNLYLNPEESVREIFRSREQPSATEVPLPAEGNRTSDGARVRLLANINLLSDLKSARACGAEGVGLYRSEIPFLVRSDFPSEEEQYQVYRRLAAGLPGQPLVCRTLDIGGDKILSYYHQEREENPFLGMRSLRFSLHHRDIFARQLRALLRAGADSDLRIMFPMVSSVEELSEARAVLEDCQMQLAAAGKEHCRRPQLGIMVEIPGIVDLIGDLAREVDFFSIGSNDLVQYLLAVDRGNEKVASFYIPHHPSVLRTLARIVGAAAETPVSICGDMASKEIYLPFLLGIGIRQFSMEPVYLPRIRRALSGIDLPQARAFADHLLTLSSVTEITNALETFPV